MAKKNSAPTPWAMPEIPGAMKPGMDVAPDPPKKPKKKIAKKMTKKKA